VRNGDTSPAAGSSLTACGPAAVPGLVELVGNRREEVRVAAMRLLGEIGDRRAADPLHPALRDASATVRATAAWALGRIGAFASLAPLLEALGDPVVSVDEALLAAVNGFGRAALGGALEALGDRNDRRRGDAVSLLGTIGDPGAAAPLNGLLPQEPSWPVRQQIAWALGRIGDRSSVEPLRRALADPATGVRSAAADALGEPGAAAAVEALVDALEDGSPEVRAGAVGALARITGAQQPRDEAAWRRWWQENGEEFLSRHR
jgi:HEAT repeat protein